MNIEIRKESEKEYFETEKMVREAFWNKYQPGCNEHYMVHIMRKNPAWLPELSRIALVDGKIAGVIMYFKSKIMQADGKEVQIASFGPLCVSHKYRNLGIGKKLMEETLSLVKKAGFPGVLIVGEPEYYPKVGFIRCKERGITDVEGNAWDPYMVYEFEKNGMNIPGIFEEPYDITDGIPPVPPAEYENQFENWTRRAIPCQFMYPNPDDEKNGYHLRRSEENPVVFDNFYKKAPFEKAQNSSGAMIRENPLMAEFLIEKGERQVGICIINFEKSQPELPLIFLEEEFKGTGIEKNISETFENANS
ncbi:MAG: N-acetyltransferase [Treponema sp.]|nr:N-acetyltransferase [Treponema sp.]